MKDLFLDRIDFLQFPFHIVPLWPNDPDTSVLVRHGEVMILMAQRAWMVPGVSVQETKPVTFRDLDISRGQQELWITLLKPRDMSIYYLY